MSFTTVKFKLYLAGIETLERLIVDSVSLSFKLHLAGIETYLTQCQKSILSCSNCTLLELKQIFFAFE